MPRTDRRSFAEMLPALALQNAHALESRVRAASSLAETYPENGEAFRAIESAALRQLFRIMAGTLQTELETSVEVRGIRPSTQFAWRIIVVIPEQEKYETRKQQTGQRSLGSSERHD